jgi:hypothetical protein
MGLRARAELSASSTGSTYRQAGPLDLKTQACHAMQTPNDYDSNSPSSNPTASSGVDRYQTGTCKFPVFWRLSRLEKRLEFGQRDAKCNAARRYAPSCMGATDGQRNWPEMRKTLGKPGFFSGEDRNRTTHKFPGKNGGSKMRRRKIRRAPQNTSVAACCMRALRLSLGH